VVRREDLDPEVVKRELEIYREQARNENKPEKILDKIAEGKLEKYYQEVCLMEQIYIKDSKQTVKDILTEAASKLGENMMIGRFARFRLGDK
ncbi:elongation factor Ts, partial [candidate division KSB1 bacterium]